MLFNIFYEVFTVCTSVVAEDLNGELCIMVYLIYYIFMTCFALFV